MSAAVDGNRLTADEHFVLSAGAGGVVESDGGATVGGDPRGDPADVDAVAGGIARRRGGQSG